MLERRNSLDRRQGNLAKRYGSGHGFPGRPTTGRSFWPPALNCGLQLH